MTSGIPVLTLDASPLYVLQLREELAQAAAQGITAAIEGHTPDEPLPESPDPVIDRKAR